VRNLAFHRGGIDERPSRIICDFETSPRIPWNPKELLLTAIKPRRQVFLVEAQITGRGSEKEDLLTSWCDALSQKMERPYLANDLERDIRIGLAEFALIQGNAIHPAGDDRAGSDVSLTVFASEFQELRGHGSRFELTAECVFKRKQGNHSLS
jgi:hypothetical protein